MKWQSFGHLFSVLALSAFGLVVTTGCEPEGAEPLERDDAVEVDDMDDDLDDDGVTNESVDIDTDPDMEPTEPLE